MRSKASFFPDYILEESKCYIKQKYISIQGVAECLRRKEKIHTVQTRIWRDKQKINKALGERMLVEILSYDEIDIETYQQRLFSVVGNNTNVKILENIQLYFNKGGNGATVTDEQLDDFIEIVMPYNRTQIKFIEDNFKRLKSILDFGELPKRRPDSVIAWLNGKLMIALLIEILLSKTSFSPHENFG